MKIANHLKNLNPAPCLAAVGHIASTVPEFLLPPKGQFDVCVTGEPEITMRELCAAILSKKNLADIRGLVLPDPSGTGILRTEERSLVQDLDELSLPAYEYFPMPGYIKMSSHVPVFGRVRWGWLLTSRGCSFRCNFCSPLLRKSYGEKYRVHSIPYVLQQFDFFQEKLHCNAISFEDDVFSFSRTRTIELCRALAQRKKIIPWVAQTRIDTLDKEVIQEMKKAGCTGLCIGIESGDQNIREKFKNCKLTNEEIQNIIQSVHDADIHTTLYFMLGFPDETMEQMQKTFEFALRLKPLMIQVGFYTPYPGSPAWNDFIKNHQAEEILKASHYNVMEFTFGKHKASEIWAFRQRFYRKFYLNFSYMWRYLSKRLPYTISKGYEFSLIHDTLAWLFNMWYRAE
jgi:radical SAM superfamily enzyme YgiQ (UPF0313 family)